MSRSVLSGRTISFNKYIVVGDKNPNDMILPLVIDIKDFEDLLNNILKKSGSKVSAELYADDICNGKFKVRISKEK